jgi:hypothetical protein
VLKLGTISLDGTKIHADASKHNAVRDILLLEVEIQLRTEVEQLFALGEQSEQPEVPDGLGGVRGDRTTGGPPGATGRDPHHPSWQQRFAPLPDPPPEDASAQVKMAYKLRTALDKAIYGARKCTVEPVIGIIKEVIGFCQFSLRGVQGAAGEWCLVCLTFNLKRFHTLSWA